MPVFHGAFVRVGPAWLLISVLLYPASASAHGIHLHARGNAIHGEAHFADDTPVRDALVTAFDPEGEKIGETSTDDEGRFTLEAKFRCDHRLLLDTGDGHGAECTVPATELPQDLPLRGDTPSSAPPRDHEAEMRVRDVIGGIGYIVGLAGIAFYFLGLRSKAPRSPV